MSKTIDERVVSMEFDNRQFEKNVSTSMSTLDKLKQKLNLEGAAKGLENVNGAAKHFDISPLSNGLETVKMKFSALEVMAVTAFANITNSAVNAGKNIVKAFTVDPIKTGLQEYETQINAVQTILANTQSKGTTLDQVNNALDELNHYADKTIYNFTEMTRNIGTFTAAGVDLDTSVSAIKGIANLAAVSGSTSQQASTAMYQLSQALSSGTVKLMDWNSVVNAGMGGQVFQDALKETARVHGIAIDDMIKEEGSFRETLSSGWLSSEILTETLSKFTGDLTEEQIKAMGYTEEQSKEIMKLGETANDAATKVKTFTQLMDTLKEAAQSGWTQTWEILIGDFEEAKSLWTEASDYFSEVLNKSAEARNNLLQGWADKGGREMAIESIKNAFSGLLSIIKPIKEAFREVFPPMTVDQLVKITEKIRDLTAKFKLSESQSAKLKSTFKGLFSIIKMGVTIVKSVVSGVAELAGKLLGLGSGVLDITGSLGEWVSKVDESITETNLFGKAIDGIVGFLGKGIDKLKEFGSYVKGKFEAPGFETFAKILASILESIKKVGAAVIKVASSIGKALGNAFRNGDMKSLLDLVNGGIFTTILLGLKKWIKGFKDFAGEGKSFVDSIKDVLGTVGDSLTAWQKNIKTDIIKKIAISIGILAASLWVLSTIDSDKLGSALAGITVLFLELIGAMSAFDKLDVKATGAGKAAVLMVGMSVAVLILASAMKKISSLNWNEIAKGLVGIAGLMTIAIGAMVALSKFAASSEKVFSISKNGIFSSKKKNNFISMGIALIAIASSMKIFASAAKDLSSMSLEELAKGMVGIGVILAEIVGFMGLMKLIKPEKMTSTGIALIAIASSMKIFASAAKDFATMNWESLGKAGAAIGGILLLAAGFGKLSSYSGKMMSSSVALVIIGAAMEIFADVCKKFGQMEWEALGKAGAAIGGILLLASGFVLLSGLAKKIKSSVIALTIIAAAMEIFADVCNKFGQMDWESLGKAGAAIGGILALTAGFALLSGLSSNVFASAASLLIMAAALRVLTPVLVTLGDMSWTEIVKGLVTIAGAFAIIGVAGLLLGPIVPAIMSLSGAVALLGLGCLAAGIGITAFAAGLGVLSTITAASATAIVAALHIIIVGILDIIPAIIDSLTRAVVALCEVFIQSIPAICEAVRVLIVEVVKVLVECVPLLVDGALKLIIGVLEALVQYTPQIVDLIFNFLIAILDGISRNLPALIQAVVNVFKALFSGVIDALNSMDPDILVKGIVGIGFISAMMVALAAMAALTPAAMIGVVGFGAVITELAAVLAVLGGLAQIPGLEWLISEGGNLLQKVGTAIGKFIGGIVGGIAEGFTSSLPNIATDLSDFMAKIMPFVVGASSIDSSMFEGVKALSTAIMYLTAADVVNGIASWLTGGSSMADFAEQLVPFGRAMNEYSKAISGINSKAIESSASAGKMIAELASSLPNSGGVAGFFAGENDMDIFAAQLIPFGEAMKEYSNAVSGIDPNSVENSAIAAKTLVELANNLPNSGGMASWFAGDNKLDSFANQLIPFGKAMKEYSNNISGINPDSVSATATAAMSIVELSNNLPNSGGMVSWFTGDNNLSSFAVQLIPFGKSMKEYADSISGIDTNAVKNSAIAAESLSELANNLPNSGGIVSWFTGDNKIGDFGKQLVPFGKGIKEYGDSISGMNTEAVTNSATAAQALVELSSKLPELGGMSSWFTGDQDLGSFGKKLIPFGEGLKSYSDSVIGLNIEAVSNSVTAAKSLNGISNELSNDGGLFCLLNSGNDFNYIMDQLVSFGSGLTRYSATILGVNAEAVTNSATATEALSKVAANIQNGNILSVFSGEGVLSGFSLQLPTFGRNLKTYSDSVIGVDANAVQNSATATGALVEVASNIRILSAFTGEGTLDIFSSQLTPFGQNLKAYSISVSGINVGAITGSAQAAKELVNVMNSMSNFHGNAGVSNFVESLNTLGTASVNNFVNAFNNAGSKVSAAISSMLGSGISAANTQTSNFVNAGNNVVKGLCSGMTASASYVSNFVTTLLDNAVAAIRNRISVFGALGRQLMQAFSNGLRSGTAAAKTSVSTMVGDCVSKLNQKYDSFYSAGGYVVDGFAAGISANTYKAEAQAKAMAEAAAQAAKDALDINSPSKVFRRIAYSIPEGFAQGIDRTTWMAEKSSKDMANSTVTATTNALSIIKDKLQNGIDAQPVMSPVVDMSSIKANNIQLSASVGSIVTKPVTSLSQIISDAQADINASNNEVISALKGLRDDLNTMYSSDGQEVALYVDAKKLASTIAKPMNRQLNILSQRGFN